MTDNTVYLYYSQLPIFDDYYSIKRYSQDFQINILSKILGVEKEKILIHKEPGGKPFLPSFGVYYNVSHSKSIICCAVSYIGRIGVDIEDIRELKELIGLAKTIFSNSTIKILQHISDTDKQLKMFFTFWTILESVLKLNGIGMSYDSICNFEFNSEAGLISYPIDIVEDKKFLYTKSMYLYNSILSIAIESDISTEVIKYEIIKV